jgi:hypothetical protein
VYSQDGIKQFVNLINAGVRPRTAATQQQQTGTMDRRERLQEVSRNVRPRAGINDFLYLLNAGNRPGKTPDQGGR